MYKSLNLLNINISKEQEEILNRYQKLFLEYNKNVNLISKNDESCLFQKHIFDSLAFNLFYQKYIKQNNINLLDIGTGGGFPSVPISLLYKNIDVTAIDSINKKIKFIENLKAILNINNITPICSRIEAIDKNNKYNVVVSRAMAELRVILEYAIPYIKTGGYFIAYKSIKADEEIKNAQKALEILNAKIIDKIEYSLPLREETKRTLIVIKKLKNTPNIYPRQNNIIKNKPL